ncbi:MAG: response regulator transcription factor [Thermoguttaceae bacterium]|jgi:DNA-binding NarL/FixJ family response regulator|nr:response regulator transcription factor [Thermoguttaceae bacterium]
MSSGPAYADQPVRVQVVHQSRLLRECLVSALSDGKHFEAVASEPALDDALRVFEASVPHTVLVDLHLPTREVLELIGQLKRASPRCKLILMARAASHESLLDCIAAGAHGCILEGASLEDLQSAIRRVLQGELFCSPEIVHSMFEQLAQARHRPLWADRVESVALTTRELEILDLIAQHLSNKQIARKLNISLYTVKNHVHNIVEKLRVEGRFQAVEYARQRHWLTQPST